MTQDELLAKINKAISIYEEQGFDANNYLYALRTVVELHRPLLHKLYGDDTQYVSCQGCGELYSCPTIQAIEKELE